MKNDKIGRRKAQSVADPFSTTMSELGYEFTINIKRRDNLNRIGQFMALNHDAGAIKRYLVQCVDLNNLEPHNVRLKSGLTFSVTAVKKSQRD
jgi:hypothetical protein